MANELNDVFAWHIARLRKLGVTTDDITIMTNYGVGPNKAQNWQFWTVCVGPKLISGGTSWPDMERRVTSYLNGTGSDQNKKATKGSFRGKR